MQAQEIMKVVDKCKVLDTDRKPFADNANTYLNMIQKET